MEKPSVLILAAGSLGDCLLTLPAVQQLQSRFEVTLAGTSPYQELGAGLLGVSRVIPLEPLLENLYRSGGMEKSEFLSQAGDVFLFFKDIDEKLLSLFKGVNLHRPSQSFEAFLQEGRWAGHYWLELVQESKSQKTAAARLQIPQELREKGRTLCGERGLASPFLIHPGSGSKLKNAPLSFFEKAAQKAKAEAGRKTLVLWGEAERSWLDEIRGVFQNVEGSQVLSEPLGLRDLAALFTQCSGYLGNDSGVTHLASACGAKTFAVFNQTDSRIWGPQEAFILETLRSLYT